MKNCKTCKHWNAPDNTYGEIPGAGRCTAVVQYWDATEWVEDQETRKLRQEYSKKLAFVKDGSDYFAALYTLEDFGCVQHENP